MLFRAAETTALKAYLRENRIWLKKETIRKSLAYRRVLPRTR